MKQGGYRQEIPQRGVAPRVGAWIETTPSTPPSIRASVAPRVGAWIETLSLYRTPRSPLSHPVWVRGLKLRYGIGSLIGESSHPVWVRGLKQNIFSRNFSHKIVAPRVGAWIETPRAAYLVESCIGVAPRVGAWIETSQRVLANSNSMSHPVWVRGLKQRLGIGSMTIRTSHPVWVRGLKPCPSRNPLSSERRRTPCGCVD